MATQFVYPIADVTTEWTPSTGTVHFSLLDETSANTTDYITVTGYSAGKVDRFVMDTGTSINAVSQYVVTLDLRSSNLANAPALQLKFFVGAVMYGFVEFGIDTGGTWDVVNWTIPLPQIPAAIWNASSIELQLKPINGDVGYSPVS